MAYSKLSAVVAVVLVVALATCMTGEGQQSTPSCAAKLIPCRDYINSTHPPADCCNPLKETVKLEKECLCNLYINNTKLLTSLGINVTQAIQLPAHCNITDATNLCNGSTTPSSTPPPSETTAKDDNGVGRLSWTGLLISLLLFCASMMLF